MCRGSTSETPVIGEDTVASADSRRLDEEAFPAFDTFLAACQDYAKFSGCRFSLAAFEGIDCSTTGSPPIVTEARSRDTGTLLNAKLRAAPVVTSIAEMLKSGDLELASDLIRAFDIVMKESVRNSMIAKCKELEIFPPPSTSLDIEETDCSWENMSAPLTTISQRLYNDEARRVFEHVDGVNPALRLAKTASFIVEFADEVGFNLPQIPQDKMQMLREFEIIATSWTGSKSTDSKSPLYEASDEIVGSFFQNAGDMATGMHEYVDSWTQPESVANTLENAKNLSSRTAVFINKHRGAVRVGTAVVALAGATGMAGLRLLRRK